MPTWTPAKIKSLRSRLRLSQSHFAKLVGMHQPTVAALETGAKVPSEVYKRTFTFLAALADRMSVEEIIELVEK